jgi:formylglycine-generating enzyme required for sulfatase activity/tRNA A-37 threonylcarbamoyl transferase component Bud32
VTCVTSTDAAITSESVALPQHSDAGVSATLPSTTASHDGLLPPGYELLGELGHGGMGVVYKARQVKANRVVALKMLRIGAHAAPADLRRFRTEAEAVARVQHRGIVQVFDVGEHRGMPFFSLEFCPGGSLADRLRERPLPPREAAEIVEVLARAVHAAHEGQVLHRDLKPSNVLLASDGTPKIADFGLAKKLDDEGQTQSGAVMGTPSYMPPEQARGRVAELGPCADVYALGAVLYECLIGRPPFKAATVAETLVQVLGDDPVPPRRLNPAVPYDLETICVKCLAKEPARRYPTARALADDLRRYRAGEPITARPAGRLERAAKWAKRRPALAALLGVTLLAIVALSVLSAHLVKLAAAAEKERQEAVKQTAIAEGKEQEALRQAHKAEKARDFLVSIFKISETNVRGGNVTAREILKEAEERIPREFGDHPKLQEELLAAIADINHSIALTVPRAMILEARGTVHLLSARGVPKPAVPQALLYLEDRLNLAADARVQLVFLSDLHKERLKPAHAATVGLKGCEPEEAVGERLDDDVMMTFVRLPRGTFYMGWDGPENPGKKTEIKEEFEIAVHTVTQGQWQAVMGNNPSFFSRTGGGSARVKDISDEELKLFPVEQVFWENALEFIKRLNERERQRGGEWLHRLPTSAEWEYACRGGAASEEQCSYHFYFAMPTNDLSFAQANFDGGYPFGSAPKGTYLGRPVRVGSYPPNKLGLCDMHGNVWQWCRDPLGGGSERVDRGGGWFNGGSICRAAHVAKDTPTDRYIAQGFRLVRVRSGGK